MAASVDSLTVEETQFDESLAGATAQHNVAALKAAVDLTGNDLRLSSAWRLPLNVTYIAAKRASSKDEADEGEELLADESASS